MMKARFFACLLYPPLIFAACSGMGMGADPNDTEGVFSLLLPAAIALPPAESPLDAENAQAGNAAQSAVGDAVASAESEQAKALPAADADSGEELAVPESKAESQPEETSPAAPLASVSRWNVSMVSAAGFELHEAVEPSAEPLLFAVQAGQWKILVIAEDSEGKAIAQGELAGISLSPGEEKPVSLEWRLPPEFFYSPFSETSGLGAESASILCKMLSIYAAAPSSESFFPA